MAMLVGTDIGGTFTDIVGFDTESRELSFGKSLTDYGDLVDGVFSCLSQEGIEPRGIDLLRHGTTQIINILIERKGVKTALVTTRGFRDVLEIGRASRPLPFDLSYRRHPPLVERALRFEVSERIDASGRILQPLDTEELVSLCAVLRRAGIEAVAVSFLNAYVNPAHEEEAARILRENLPDVYVTGGAELSREWFEYERTSTAVANAYVGPRASRYIQRFDEKLRAAGFAGRFVVMASHGGVLSQRRATEQPVALVESGPIGGCIGATAYARELRIDRMIAFDMGGTTAKCALIENASFDIQSTYYVGGYDYGIPLRTPVLDIIEVGTGGGSIAFVDAQGSLHVGPRSAGSDPGPVCFGRGGAEPTVTDANLALGRIGSGAFLSGSLQLDGAAAIASLIDGVGRRMAFGDRDLDRVAGGVLALANAQMGSAIKEVTVERGKDARDFALFAFGGGGPLHACDLARELRISRVIVPPEPGNFSALGMLFAPARIDESRTVRLDLTTSTSDLGDWVGEMEAAARAALRRDFDSEAVEFERRAELRFKGQRHTIRVAVEPDEGIEPLRIRFFETYERRYGRADRDGVVELIGLRVTAKATVNGPELGALHRAPRDGLGRPHGHRPVYFASTGRWHETPVYTRYALPIGSRLVGPGVIEEFGATTVIGPDDRLTVGSVGELQIDVVERGDHAS
jgi:N-methylhydantoinase A